jgi:hypothetical protein
VLAFLVRLVFVVVLARLVLGLLRLLQGPRRRKRPPETKPPEIPSHLRDDIVDGEFEELRQERDP